MAQPCPELLFLSGPQEGQRAVLIKPVMLAGRAEACDIHIAEASASRQHLRFEATADGCLLEVLSIRGIRINGKSYKPSKNILLDSGDCLELGADTRMLFVAAGDDPEAVLAAYRQAHPAGQPAQKEKPPPPAPKEEAPARKDAAPRPGAAPPPLAVPEASQKDQAHRAKVRKYAILGGVYALAMVGLVIFLSTMNKADIPRESLTALTNNDIDEAISAPITRSVNENLAAEELQKALAAYDSRNFQFGNLQRCVKSFKLHLAYRNKQEFEDPENARRSRMASGELAKQVTDAYGQALISEKAQIWPQADRKWKQLCVILPKDEEWNTDAYNKVVKNVWDHAAYTRSHVQKP
jgi:hypothetical protein